MRRLTFGDPLPGGFEAWVKDALRQIENASLLDVEQIMLEYTVTGAFTETRTLDTATATLPDVVNFLATLISDIQRGGQKRSYAT